MAHAHLPQLYPVPLVHQGAQPQLLKFPILRIPPFKERRAFDVGGEMLNHILDTGISVAYAPENCPPIVDIVFVHGLQGHPYKTWTCKTRILDTLVSSALTSEKEEKRNSIRRIFRESSNTMPQGESDNGSHLTPVFWPAELLPQECPNSRILTFGYDSKITKYAAGAINLNKILSHGKDLLFDLCRERDPNRPLIFVAHSLGGIIVKEMLAQSSSSKEDEQRNIVESTAMVMFLGTPHRGSQDVAALGEVVRSIVSAFGMETTPVILDALGLKTSDLERAQENFSRVWQRYDFQVKTFQEGLILAKLGKKVVPDYSSLIGDHREHAETLQANHMEMCRYSGRDDPNYRKVAGELRLRYQYMVKLQVVQSQGIRQLPSFSSIFTGHPSKEEPPTMTGGQVNEACFESLWFPAMNFRHQSLERPADQTCSWLFSHRLYQDWFDGRSKEETNGLLWVKGKPGAGKSTIMKEALRRAALGQGESNHHTASFFFSAKGGKLEHSSLGLFQSLLYQLLPGSQEHFKKKFHKMWVEKNRIGVTSEGISMWTEAELLSFTDSVLRNLTRRTIIFIDGLDECDSDSGRSIAQFWRRVTRATHAAGIDLNVCLSSRHFPTITLGSCPEIFVEQHNKDDIATYVDQKLRDCMGTEETQWKRLREKILSGSGGIFLWVVLVVEDALRSWDDGNGMPYLIRRVMDIPKPLQSLYSMLFSNIEPQARELTVRLFQWAIFAVKPLRLHEWRHIMAFIRRPAPKSLKEWRESVYFIDNDEQLEKQIRSVSRGLVEVKRAWRNESLEEELEATSIHAGAGSLNLEHGDTRVVQVIHESVREFFISTGFFMLDPNLMPNTISKSHFSIMSTCLDYIEIRELDALVKARIQAARRKSNGKFLANKLEGSNSVDSSPQDNHTGYQNSLPDNKQEQRLLHSKQLVAGEEVGSVFELLQTLDHTPGINIVEWMAKRDAIPDEQLCMDMHLCGSATYSSSQISRSQVLEDYPALLSYATFKLFDHAQLAEHGASVDPRNMVRRLHDTPTWTRWVVLRENIPQETDLKRFVRDMGLKSWTKAIAGGVNKAFSATEKLLTPNDPGNRVKMGVDGSPPTGSPTSPQERKAGESKRARRAGQYRGRSAACEQCRMRKTRCIISTGNSSGCVNCIRLKKQCSFEYEQVQVTRPAPSKAMEDGLAKLEASLSTQRAPRSRASSVASFGSAGSHDGQDLGGSKRTHDLPPLPHQPQGFDYTQWEELILGRVPEPGQERYEQYHA